MLKVNKDFSASAVAKIGGLDIYHYNSIEPLQPEWLEFEKQATGSIFQTFDWCFEWLKIWATPRKLEIRIVVGRNSTGAIAFILPLQIMRKWGNGILQWIGQSDFTYGGGLFNESLCNGQWLNQYGAAVFATVTGFNIFNLQNTPRAPVGVSWSADFLGENLSANPSFQLELHSSFDALHRTKRSAKSISKIRRRDERLEQVGVLKFEHVIDETQAEAAIKHGLQTKTEQLREAGVTAKFTMQDEAFYIASLHHNLHVFQLTLDGKTLCTMIGALFQNRFILLISALNSNEVEALSPGDYLLRKTIEFWCNKGLKYYDFGEGEQAYKLAWADARIELYSYIATRNVLGLPLALVLRTKQSLKRRIKATPQIRNVIFKMRKTFFGRRR
jgi:CelD/BcsL family acetyltransferase involved in cellulose biosynthesis